MFHWYPFAISVPQRKQNLQPKGLHTQKLSLASRVYILKNYPWRPGSTYYSKTIPDIQGLHNMKETWNRHEKSTCQSAGHCHTLLWCCNVFHWYPFCNFSSTKTKSKSSTPGSTYSKTIPGIQGLHTTQKKIKAPGSDEHGLFAGGPDSEEAGLAHDPTGMN